MQEQLSEAVLALLSALDEGQRAKIQAPFDTPDHKTWTYLPGDRPGLRLAELSPAQQRLAERVLEIGCSGRGLADSLAVLDSEVILRELPESDHWAGSVVGERYFFRVLGDPAGPGPWAWRLNGHHLAIHVTLIEGAISFTPQFIGANPATAPDGRRFLAAEQDLGFQLLHSLEAGQREQAVFSDQAPTDILTRRDPVVDPKLLHRGLAYGDMTEQQRQYLSLLVGQYVGRAAGPIALRSWQDITDQGIERLTFAWAGSDQPGAGHYYSIAGPTFLAEYDNTQNNANHIHSVWRDLHHDWNTDVLARHYAVHSTR